MEVRTQIIEIDVFLKVDAAFPEKKPVAVTSQDVSERSEMKLPKLEIAEFGGNPREYRAFQDAFREAIDENRSLSKIEKFTYLRSYLTGEAEVSITGLATTD